MPISTSERDRIYGRCQTARIKSHRTPWGDTARVHELVLSLFAEACNEASRVSGWKPRRIDSYNCRNVRGSQSPSLHSYGLAWDFFATDEGVPPPGGVWKPDNTVPHDFAQCFTRRGFRWGANFSRQDWPHIEWPHAAPTTGKDVHPMPMNNSLVAIMIPKSGTGYWAVGADGGVFTFGDLAYHGSMGGQPLAAPVSGGDCLPDGSGYWLCAQDGGVFTFGKAEFYGSLAGTQLASPIVDMRATPTGKGYWLVEARGGIHARGDAAFFGRPGL